MKEPKKGKTTRPTNTPPSVETTETTMQAAFREARSREQHARGIQAENKRRWLEDRRKP